MGFSSLIHSALGWMQTASNNSGQRLIRAEPENSNR
jgi:hypothetical protein